MEPQQNSKKMYWVVVLAVLVIAIAGVYYWMTMSQTPEAVSGDVQSGLDSVGFNDLDAEMQTLDTDINQL